jgi:hypothetical protein
MKLKILRCFDVELAKVYGRLHLLGQILNNGYNFSFLLED